MRAPVPKAGKEKSECAALGHVVGTVPCVSVCVQQPKSTYAPTKVNLRHFTPKMEKTKKERPDLGRVVGTLRQRLQQRK